MPNSDSNQVDQSSLDMAIIAEIEIPSHCSTDTLPAGSRSSAYPSDIFHFLENASTISSSCSSLDHRDYQGTKSKRNKKLMKLLIACITLIGISAGIATASLHQLWNSSLMTPVFTDVDMSIRVINETFQNAMMMPNSSEFRDFGAKFCTNILLALYGKVNDARCQVNNLRPGSIIVNFSLELLAPENVTLHNVKQWLGESALGVIETDPSSLRVFANASEKEFHLVQLRNLTSECLSASLPILPLSYTFPHHCRDYQVCVDGLWRLEKCPDGLEFAYGAPEDDVICTPPSPNTYCSRRRSQNGTQKHISVTSATTDRQEITSPSTTGQPASLRTFDLLKSSTSSVKLAVTSDITRTSTGTSAKPFSSIPLDGKSIFACPRSGQHFLPANDTYPSNCGKYQHCNEGYSYLQTCPEGTVYAYANYVCTSIVDPNGFCNIMKSWPF